MKTQTPPEPKKETNERILLIDTPEEGGKIKRRMRF